MRIDATSASKVLRANYKPDGVQRRQTAESSDKLASPVASVRITPFAKGLSAAIRLHADSAPASEEAVARGKEIIKNWRPPTDEQIDTIMRGVSSEG